MNCLEFRRRVGAEPAASGYAIDSHRSQCPACARHQDELRAMDALIGRALAVDVRRFGRTGAAVMPAAPKLPRTRWLAMAASVVIGFAVGAALWLGSPRPSLAREVIGHVVHEPGTMMLTGAIAPEALAAVLDPDGTHLHPGIGEVSYAKRCLYEGHVVPHLVVRMPQGAVTVLLLRHRNVSEPVRVSEQGYVGVVLPAPRGSIAIVGYDQNDLDGVARQVFDAVDWGS
ncbi:MAG: DUF3379 family protein [Steroidobacteraceae bacterium]